MPNVNYLNPASFAPANEFKANGPLGGLMWARQADDYEKLMQTQHLLQQIGLQTEQQKLAEFMSGAPLREQERSNKMEVLQGEAPFLRDAAGQRVQTEAAGNQFKRETEYSDDKKSQFFWNLKKERDEQGWKNIQRELTVGGDLANQAIQIAQTQGEAAAIGWMQQQIGRMKQAGVNLPEKQFLDPKGWSGIVNSARNSVEQMQKIDQQAQKDNAAMDRTKVTAGATVEAAQYRATAAGANRKPRTNAEALLRSRETMMDPDATPEEKEQARTMANLIVQAEWQKHVEKNMALQADIFASRNNTPEGEKARKRLEEAQRRFLQDLGVGQTVTPQGGRPEDAGSGTKPKTNFETGKVYRDKNGNTAKYVGPGKGTFGPKKEWDKP